MARFTQPAFRYALTERTQIRVFHEVTPSTNDPDDGGRGTRERQVPLP